MFVFFQRVLISFLMVVFLSSSLPSFIFAESEGTNYAHRHCGPRTSTNTNAGECKTCCTNGALDTIAPLPADEVQNCQAHCSRMIWSSIPASPQHFTPVSAPAGSKEDPSTPLEFVDNL